MDSNHTSIASFNAKDISLESGNNSIYGKTVDQGKQSLASKTLTVTFNESKPKLIISEPEDGREIKGGDKKVTISGITDNDASVYVNNGQIIVSKDGSFTTSIPLNDGENTITVKAVNSASTSTTIDLKVTYRPEDAIPSPSPTN